MESMTPNMVSRWAEPADIAAAIDLVAGIRHKSLADIASTVHGMSRSTIYRKMQAPEALTIADIQGIATVLNVPEWVLTSGRFFTLRWLAENDPDHDGGGAVSWAPRGSNPRPSD